LHTSVKSIKEMLRSLICPDIEDSEELIEVEDNVQKEDSGCKPQPTINEQSRENRARIFLDQTQKKLRYLTSLHSETQQNKKRNKELKKADGFRLRKRKVDIGDTSIFVKQNSENAIVPKSNELSKKDIHKSSDGSKKCEAATKFTKKEIILYTNKCVLEHLTEQDFKVEEVYDPHGIKKSKIEKDLDEAIKQRDFELAQQISDEISDRQLSEKISNNFKACTYLEKKKVEKEAKESQRRKLRWMFDHKERWELKGNM